MSDELRNILNNHTGKITDSWQLYTDLLENILSPFREKPISLFEIGIFNGGSLEIWSKYFPAADHIIGCDIDPRCAQLQYQDPRISVIIGDANTASVEEKLQKISTEFYIIIDDGSHHSEDIIKSFFRYFPHLKEGGLYLVEDLHASYWKGYGGGLYHPYSAMSFFKRLSDVINLEHWLSSQSVRDHLKPFTDRFQTALDEKALSKIKSVQFYNSICLIRTCPPEENKLGERVIYGSEAPIVEDVRPLSSSTVKDMVKTAAPDLTIDEFSLYEENQALEKKISTLKSENKACQEKINQMEQEILFYSTSKSWQITKPLRFIMDLFRRKSP